MRKTAATLTAMAAGGALMFLFDPRSGRRRRGLLRDKLVHAGSVLQRSATIILRDLDHRARGKLHELASRTSEGPVPDEILVERVRARLGRLSSHPHAIEVRCEEGRVHLSGKVLAHEARQVVRGVLHVRGVRHVDNGMEVHTREEHLAELQGGKPRTGEKGAFRQAVWAPTTRFAAGSAGLALLGVSARHAAARAGALALGLALVTRSVTNRQLKNLLRTAPAKGAPVAA